MEQHILIRQQDQLMQLAQELASASQALATSFAGDEAAISAPAAYELLTTLMETLMTLIRSMHALRSRLVASLYRTESGLSLVDLMTGKSCDSEESVLVADADMFSSATSLELAERCLSRARNALSTQEYELANGNPAITARST